jgi:hypothetical protein
VVLVLVSALLFVRVLTDDRSASDSRYSGGLNLSAVIALVLIVVAFGLLIRRRRAVVPVVVSVSWIAVWTAIAVGTRGASTETLREGVREASVVALGVVVFNAGEAFSVTVAARLVQLIGCVPATVALYQLVTGTGMNVAHHIRSNGTLAHPNSAAMFFAIAVLASLWLFLCNGKRRSDAALVVLFATALLATFSIDGLITLVCMLVAFGGLSSSSARVRLLPCAIGALITLTFFVTPLGSARIASESPASLATAEGEEPDSTFAWRLHKWKTLLPEWERHPLVGRGLGTTTNVEFGPVNEFTGALPHNEYIRYLVETGAVGLALLAWALVILVRCLFRKRRAFKNVGGTETNAVTLAIAVVVGCLVNSVADNTLLNSPTCYAVALVVISVLGQDTGNELRRRARVPRFRLATMPKPRHARQSR